MLNALLQYATDSDLPPPEWTIESILDHSVSDNGTIKLLVSWSGFTKSANSWESLRNFYHADTDDIPVIVHEYAASLPHNIGAAVQRVGILRRKLRKVAPAQEEGPKRMQWYARPSVSTPSLQALTHLHRMSKVCEQWTLDQLCDMTEEDMETLLGFYRPGTVPSLEQVRLQEPDGAYDGPFLI